MYIYIYYYSKNKISFKLAQNMFVYKKNSEKIVENSLL